MSKKITIKDLEAELTDQLKLIKKMMKLVDDLVVLTARDHDHLEALTQRVNELSDLARYQQGFYD